MGTEVTRKDFLKLSGAASLTAALSGCSFGVGGSKSGSGDGSGSFAAWDIAVGDEREIVKARNKRFNSEHSDLTVNMQFFQNNPYKDKLRIAMGAGAPPDIFFGWGGGVLKSYAEGNQVYDLTSVLNENPEWKNSIPESVLAPVTFDEKIYGVPNTGVSPVVFFYNEDMFSQHSLAPPGTWEELLTTVETLKQNNVTPITVGGKSQWPLMMYFGYLADRIGGPDAFESILNEESKAWSQSAYLEAATKCQDLVRMNAFEDGFNSVSYDTGQASALMYQEKAAMHLMGAWEYTQNFVTNAPEFIEQGKLGWFAFPAVAGGEGDPSNLVGGAPNFYSITVASQNKDACLTYLREGLMDKQEINARIAAGSVPPVTGVEDQLKQADKYREWLLAANEYVENAKAYTLPYDQALRPEAAQALLTNVTRLFLMEITPKQFVKNMNETIQA